MLFRRSLATLLLGRPTLYPFLAMIGNWPGPATAFSRQYSYNTDRMVGVTVLAISTYRYARR